MPQVDRLEVPYAMHLAKRPTRDPRDDERPTLRTADGHVLAVVEQWRPN